MLSKYDKIIFDSICSFPHLFLVTKPNLKILYKFKPKKSMQKEKYSNNSLNNNIKCCFIINKFKICVIFKTTNEIKDLFGNIS